MSPQRPAAPNKPLAGLLGLLQPYRLLVVGLVLITVTANALNLAVPKIISHAIDDFSAHTLVFSKVIVQFFAVALLVLVLTYLQNVVQIYAAERVARHLRGELAAKISVQSYASVDHVTPAKLLTNLTSDIDGVKLFVSQAMASIIASIFLIIGAGILLISVNWRLGLTVLGVVPLIGTVFQMTIRRSKPLFRRAQEAVDWLNRVINESILGSMLVRLLNTEQLECDKFIAASAEARDTGLKTLRLFAAMLPIITLGTNLATVLILWRGGHYVIDGSMSLGDFAAFNSYLLILIYPVILIGFMGNVIAQAGASYQRISVMLNAPDAPKPQGLTSNLRGDIALRDVSLAFGDKMALRNVTISAPAGTRTAIIGPTGAGKTQILYLLIGLLPPTSGEVMFDGEAITAYNKDVLHRQAALVFQDSAMFNLSLRENITFGGAVAETELQKAIATAELSDFVASLPQGLDTLVSERGTSLSGGQKQRIMLARALALNPRVLLLDDFTARVDAATERAIVRNVRANYPGITLISVTQNIAPVMDYDQIVLLMDGEVLATGTHDELMSVSPEYVQFFDSQRSTSQHEVHA